MSFANDVPFMSERMHRLYAKHLVCTTKTRLVLEGYPRSGNTFTVDYLFLLTGRTGPRMKIAHHTHDAYNVVLGRALNVPSVVLLRNPLDAITSYMIYSGGNISIGEAIDRYERFHATIKPIRKDILIAPFETSVEDFNSLVHTINERFRLNIPLSDNPTQDAETAKETGRIRALKTHGEDLFAARVGMPNEERKRQAAESKDQVAEMLKKRPLAMELYDFLKNTPQ